MASEKLWTKNFIAGTLINFLLMVNYYVLMVVIADYSMKTYDVPASVAGLSASIFIIGALIARLVAGGIIERVGRKRLLIIGATLDAVFSLLYLFGAGLGFLFVIRVIHGFAYGACSTTIGTIVTSVVPASKKGEGVGYYMLSVTLGAAIGPFLGMFLTQSGGFQLIFYVCIATAVLSLLAALTLTVPPTKPAVKRAGAAGAEADGAAATAEVAEAAKPSFIRRIIEVPVIPISAVCCIIFFCYSSLLTFLTPYAQELDLATEGSFFFIVYAFAMFITRPLTGKLFDRRGDRAAMLPAFVGFMAGMVLLGMATNVWMMMAAAALLGFGVGTIQSSGLALAVRQAPDERLGLANSTFYVFLDTGVGIGPLVLGFMQPVLGYAGLYTAMAGVVACALVLYLVVSRKKAAA